jgi:hypothetical protein
MNLAVWLALVVQMRVVSAPLCGSCATWLLARLKEMAQFAYEILRRASCISNALRVTFPHGKESQQREVSNDGCNFSGTLPDSSAFYGIRVGAIRETRQGV